MSNFLKNIYIGILFVITTCAPAFAQVNRVVEGGIFPHAKVEKNYILNFGAEKNATFNILQSSSITTRNTSSPLFDNADFAIDATASGQTVKWLSASKDTGLTGNCSGSLWYNGDASLYKMYVETSGAAKLSQELTLTNVSSSTQAKVYFPCTSGARVVIESTSASAAAINVDNVSLGKALDVGSVAQAVLYGSLKYDATTNCQWTHTSSTFASFSADTDCATPSVTGNASAPGTKIPGITFTSLPPGVYRIVAYGSFRNNSSAAGTSYFRLTDGTNTTGIQTVGSATVIAGQTLEAMLTYTTAQSNITIQVQGRQLTGGAGNNVEVDARSEDLSIDVYYFPSASSQVVKPQSQGWFVAAEVSGANPSLGTSAVTSYTEITNGSLTMTPRTGSAPAGIMCSSTNAAATPTTSTSTCSAGNESLGVTFNIPEPGYYKACFYGSGAASVNNGTAANAFQLIETPTNAQTLTQEGGGRHMASSSDAGVSEQNFMATTCGTFYFSSVGQKGIRLMYELFVAGTVSTNYLTMDASASVGQRNGLFTVEKIAPGIQNPYLVGSVQTDASGVYKQYAATITCSAASSIDSQSATWLASVSNVSSGACAVTFSGTPFSSSSYYCADITAGTATGAFNVVKISGKTTSGFTLTTLNQNGATTAAGTNTPLDLICFGPK